MRSRNRGWAFLAVSALAAACVEQPAEPTLSGPPVFAVAGAAACPTPATTVVTNEAELLAALADSSPGPVIGISGTIAVTAGVVVSSSVTLTCATPGSGLAVDSGAVVGTLLTATAPFVTIDRLLLNGTGAGNPFLAGTFAANTRFTNNDVSCGTGTCAFFTGAPGSLIADNRFTASGSVSGVHIQPGAGAVNPDSTRVERNVIVTTAPSLNPNFGGVRVVGGTNVVIANNTVLGPWQNSLSPTSAASLSSVITPVVAGNHFEGAVLFGIRLGAGGAPAIRVRDGVFRNNRVTGAGIAGVQVVRGCGNLFLGNNLQGNAGGLGLVFASPSGGNTFVGNEKVAVAGAGPFDCDGDGVPDPNVISGLGAVLTGVNLGAAVSDGVVESNAVLQ